jgi:hypothetical protein
VDALLNADITWEALLSWTSDTPNRVKRRCVFRFAHQVPELPRLMDRRMKMKDGFGAQVRRPRRRGGLFADMTYGGSQHQRAISRPHGQTPSWGSWRVRADRLWPPPSRGISDRTKVLGRHHRRLRRQPGHVPASLMTDEIAAF